MASRPLPSEHEAERLRHNKREQVLAEERKRAEAQLHQAIDAALKSEWGRIIWAHLFNFCGYNKSSLSRLSNNDVAVLTTECKEAQRLIYVELRKLASPELLAKVEFRAEFGEAAETAAEKPTTEKKGG